MQRAKAVDFCRSKGLDVVQGKSPGLPLPAGAFDLALSMYVIEHISDPRQFTEDLVGLVRPGAVVTVVTDNAWVSQYAWERLYARLCGRIAPFRTSTGDTRFRLVFQCDSLPYSLYLLFSTERNRSLLHWDMA